MLRALDEFVIEGVHTTIPAHRLLLENPEFVDGSYTTRTVEGGALDALASAEPVTDAGGEQAVLLVEGVAVRLWHPAMAQSVSAATHRAGGGSGEVVAPMHGTLLKVLVAEGDTVETGDPVAVLEAMKMETHVAATTSGTVAEVLATPGDVVEAAQVLVRIR